MRTIASTLGTLALTLTFVASPEAIAYCWGQVYSIINFDASQGEKPESVAVDTSGNVYVSVATTGNILKRTPYGYVSTYANIDAGPGFVLGLATEGTGTVYAAVASFVPGTHGVYKVSPGGQVEMIADFDAATTLPDDVALSYDGYLYVTEAIGGAIHRIDMATYESEEWFQDELLVGGDPDSGLSFPVGANGLALNGYSLVVSNTEGGRLVQIPIDCDGDPGDPTVLAEEPILEGADGIALDVFGNVYVTVNADNLLLRVSSYNGDIDILADEDDGLDFPTAVAFGRGFDRMSLYITNFAFYSGDTGNPALLKTYVGSPGLPLP
ncbi:MAG TPA: hypothetical protein ENJ18_03970 [Nannocystis exedens]|nr:hypothetical protein [Nannocystis exedens]